MSHDRLSYVDDEAVSPVISTILMIAITVVLAVMVFVGVSDEEPDEVPRIAFESDFSGQGGRLTVVSVTGDSGEAHWSRVAIGDASTASCTLPAGEVHAGDVLVCTTEGKLILTYELSPHDTVLLYDAEIR